jgi:general secretion pathway protein F
MIFEYQAIDSKGKNVSDIIDAPNPIKARERLRNQGLYVVKITTKSEIAKNKKNQSRLHLFSERLSDTISRYTSSKQVWLFSRQLATLLSAGMPLLRAIGDILEQTENRYFKNIIANIKTSLEEGQSLSQSLARNGGIFSEMYVNMVRVGENLGSLETIIERLSDIEEKRNLLRSKIQAAMLYPIFMMFFATLIIIFLMVKIIPSISQVFIQLGKELPLPTQIILGISSFMSSFWWLIPIIFLSGFFIGWRYIHTPKGKEQLHQWLLTAPVISSFYKKQLVLVFTRNLGILLNSNVDIIRSFDIVKKLTGNVIIEKRIEEAATRIKEGASVSKSLARADFLPKLVIGMIAAGEASDTLDEMLIRIGLVYEREIDLTIQSLTSIIEPVIIIIMGIIIGFIVVSVMLPIFEMNTLVQ